MLSRKTRGEIIKLVEIGRRGVLRLKTERKAAIHDECIAALSFAEKLCEAELAAVQFRSYKDVIEALKDAIHQLHDAGGNDEIATLSIELLDWLCEEINKEPVKKEIVFLPYNASMWDSLESIWKAAEEDKDHCNAYVVPIPYADLIITNENKFAVHEWHCEKDMFPRHVPTIDCDTVNLEEMHPDIIFIHNPYDDTNIVTSVEPKYYSSNLKKCTDKLIYVPYFVVGDAFNPDFAKKPGVLNADYVIVQDERVKDLYERNYPGGNPPEGKFLALGSPKFDKVLHGKRDDYTLPVIWKRISHGKKIVLYSTSVTTALRYTDKICDKLRFVFDSFRERKDAVLWWRPHPLMESTLRSMRPDILEEYEQLKQQYINDGWGIYDDTADLDRAIICSDMYYGDPSSVVELYKITGKPVLYQEMEYTKPAGIFDVPVWTQAMCSDGESLWFVEGKINLLMQYHIKSKRLICRGFLPNEARMQDFAYNAIAYANGKVFMLPAYGNNIYMYDIKAERFSAIEYPEQEKYRQCEKFREAFVYGDMLCCIPSHYEYFLRINIHSLHVEVVANVKDLYEKAGLQDGGFISAADWYGESVISALIYRTNKIISWNLSENVFEIKALSATEGEYGSIAVTPDAVYLAGRFLKDEQIRGYADMFERVSGEKLMWAAKDMPAVRTIMKNRIVLWNSDVGHWAVLDTKDNSVLYEGGMESRSSGALQFLYHTFICCRDKTGAYGFSCHDNTFYVFDERGVISSEIKLSFGMAEKLPALTDFMQSEVFFELPGLLDEMLNRKAVEAGKLWGDASGGKIYEAVCK